MMNKKHVIYYTENKLSGKFYIGMHSTTNINDGYMGSGLRLLAEIRKYGQDNFSTKILETLETREQLKIREAEIVNDDLLSNPLCLNLRKGGDGWDSKEASQAAIKGNVSPNRNRKAASLKIEATKVERNWKNHFGGKHNTYGMQGKQHSDLSKIKMSISGSGEKNSQFGSCWVTNSVKPIKIKKEQLDEYLLNGYSRGRK